MDLNFVNKIREILKKIEDEGRELDICYDEIEDVKKEMAVKDKEKAITHWTKNIRYREGKIKGYKEAIKVILD